ncbi:MAG: putative selenate reductase subunit YgfK, partial [Oscillibacter sp.]|nr:putative selenate reductase subunit YgfK [Oscillibacter sp.]
DAAIEHDASFLRALGVDIRLHSPVNSYHDLEGQGFTHILFATGARKHGELRLECGESVNFADILSALRKGETLDLGPDVAVVGAGNSAMDTARAVKRLPGVKNVRMVYRRTAREMPAEEEELALALEEGVEFLDLLNPASLSDGVLTCHVMEPGEPGPDGRRSVRDTGKNVTIPCTTLIAAVGERIDETPDVGPWPVIGDRKGGPGTVVEAIADAAAAVNTILDGLNSGAVGADSGAGEANSRREGESDAGNGGGFHYDKYAPQNGAGDREAAEACKGKLCGDCTSCGAGERCLECATLCELCTDVCPNRANIAVNVPGLAMPQIVHVDGMCNECGNCAVFCPYDSAPYRDKLTLFWSREDFENSSNQGWLPLDGNRVLVRLNGNAREADLAAEDCGVDGDVRAVIRAVREMYPWMLCGNRPT